MNDNLAGSIQLERGLLSDQIYTHIKAMIKDGTLVPGEQLVESKLARSLGVSQAPVREAVKRLGHEGLVTHMPHHGNFVTEYSREEADDARIARIALEEMSARLLSGRLDDDAHARLATLIDAMRTAATTGDIGDFREHDFAFHRTVIEATGNVQLPKLWDILEPSLRSMHVLSDPRFTGDWGFIADTHQELLDVLVADDPGRAASTFADHALGVSGSPGMPLPPELNRLGLSSVS